MAQTNFHNFFSSQAASVAFKFGLALNYSGSLGPFTSITANEQKQAKRNKNKTKTFNNWP